MTETHSPKDHLSTDKQYAFQSCHKYATAMSQPVTSITLKIEVSGLILSDVN